MNIYVRDVSTN
jgi:hypothetical protein